MLFSVDFFYSENIEIDLLKTTLHLKRNAASASFEVSNVQPVIRKTTKWNSCMYQNRVKYLIPLSILAVTSLNRLLECHDDI